MIFSNNQNNLNLSFNNSRATKGKGNREILQFHLDF